MRKSTSNTLQISQNSLTVRTANLDLNEVFKNHHFVYYQLPPTFNFKGNIYQQTQIKLRNQLCGAYFLDRFRKRVFATFSKDLTPPLLVDFSPGTIQPKPALDVVRREPKLLHVVIKVLLHEYGNQGNHGFSARGQYYLLASPKSDRSKWRKCLEFNLFEDQRSENAVEYLIRDTIFQLAPISVSDALKKGFKDTEYFRRTGQNSFVALRAEEVKACKSDLFEKRTSSKFRNSIVFHTIGSEEAHFWSRSNLTYQFLNGFCGWITKRGVQADPTQRSYDKVSSSPSKVVKLSKFDSEVLVLDSRIHPEVVPFDQIFKDLSAGAASLRGELSETKFRPIEEFPKSKGEPVLVLLDADETAFHEDTSPFAGNYSDPYLELRNFRADFAIQAIIVNSNKYQEITDEDTYFGYAAPEWDSKIWKPQFQKALMELQLKRLLLPGITLSQIGLTARTFEGLAFVHLNDVDSRAGTVSSIIEDRFFAATLDDLLNHTVEWPQPWSVRIQDAIERAISSYAAENYGNSPREMRLVIGQDFIWSVEEGKSNTPRRPLLPDDIVSQRLESLEKARRIAEFIVPKEIAIHESQLGAWNNFLSGWDNDFANYKQLKGSAYEALGLNSGPAKSDFDAKLSEALGFSLVSAKKEGLLGQSQGIWYCQKPRSYYSGSFEGYNLQQKRSDIIRHIHVYEGRFDPDRYFLMLNVDFVRSSGFTVQPFPFKLMREKEQIMNANRKKI